MKNTIWHNLTLRVDDDLFRLMQSEMERTGLTQQAFIRWALKYGMKQIHDKPPI